MLRGGMLFPFASEPERAPVAPAEPEQVTDNLITLLEQIEDHFGYPADDE